MGVPNDNPCTSSDVKSGLRADFTSNLVYGLAFGTPKFYIAHYGKINHRLVNMSANCDVKSGLRLISLCILLQEVNQLSGMTISGKLVS